MKIGLVCPYNIAHGGGVQECVRAMRTELQRRGHQVKIITPRPRDVSRCDKRGVIFMGNGVDFNSPLSTTPQLSASIDTDSIDAMLERENFDILHFHEPWVPLLSYQILMRSQGVNVATFHAKLPDNVMGRTLTRVVAPYTKASLKYLHQLSAVSDPAAEYVRTMTSQPITIIPNGIDLRHYHKPRATENSKPNKNMILYIGRLEQRKGLRYLIEAFGLLQAKYPDLALNIVGDGPQRRRLESLVRQLDVQNVNFAGYISEQRKVNLLRSADLFCSPAVFGESFGIVLLEAMASGLPVVAGDNPGYTSVMRGLGAISLVNPRDTAGFAGRIDLLLHEEQLRGLWRQWAKQAVQDYSYPKIVDQYEKMYAQAIAERAKPKQLKLHSLGSMRGGKSSQK